VQIRSREVYVLRSDRWKRKKRGQPIAAAWGQPLSVHERLLGVYKCRGSSFNSCAWDRIRALRRHTADYPHPLACSRSGIARPARLAGNESCHSLPSGHVQVLFAPRWPNYWDRSPRRASASLTKPHTCSVVKRALPRPRVMSSSLKAIGSPRPDSLYAPVS
jgi:hypothetical protein